MILISICTILTTVRGRWTGLQFTQLRLGSDPLLDHTIIAFADWYHYLSTTPPGIPYVQTQALLQTFLILTTSAFNTTLINGKGRYLGGPQDVPLAVVSVTYGKR